MPSPAKRSRSPRRWPAAIKALLIITGAGIYFFPPSSGWVERHYSTGLYPKFQRVVTALSNHIPFAISDALILLVVIGIPTWWIICLRRAGRGHRRSALLKLAYNTLTLAAGALLVFELFWGLNYVRIPLIEKLDYQQNRVTGEAIGQIGEQCVTQLNAASADAHAKPWPNATQWSAAIKPSFESVVAELGVPGGTTPGRVKGSIFNFYLAASGIDGFMDPYGLEVILNRNLSSVEQPFAMAHEWAHLAGFADESEANFIALLTCLRSGDTAVRYAGWLALYPELPVIPNDPKHPEAEFHLDPHVVADLKEIYRRRDREIRPWVNIAQWRFYDRFLKANRVTAGVASYGLFIRLLAGTRFDPNWTPSMRPKG
jgi:hypothetical protein